MSADSVKRRVRIVGCELWTADSVRTADCGPGVKCRQQTTDFLTQPCFSPLKFGVV